MGRKPKPLHLKVIAGNPGKRPLPEPGPTPPAGKIERPTYLQGRAIELWDEYRPALEAMGTLTVVDVPNFAMWCSIVAAFEEDPRGTKAAVMAQARLLASSLGMDAGSRAKLGASTTPRTVDAADKYFQHEARFFGD